AGETLLSKLGVGGLSLAQAGGVRASASRQPDANRWYAEGLVKLRTFDLLSGKNLLEKSVAADPNFAQAHATLSLAWDHLGYHEKARQEASKAVELSGNLPREEKLSILARYQETNDQYSQAADTYHTLFSFFPDNIEYGISLARAQAKAGKGHDALA